MLRLLAEGANARGDQFTRVVSAYFATLGYSGFRFNVHKAGRELDLQGSHAFEPRLLRAECKATATPIGGADLNKFFGVLERERSSNLEAEIQGYFVSLSGFTETAIEQEAPSPRFIVVNGEEIVAQIIAGRVVASEDVSVAQAAALMKDVRPTASFVPGGSEILVGDSGWYWLVRFQDGIEPLATVLSADGSELFGEQIDEEERQGIEAAAGVTLCLRSAPTRGIDVEDSKRQHLEALSTRCGSITLDGLPTDEGLGGRTFRLEDAYVELQLAPAKGARSAVRMVKARQLGGEESPGEDAVGDPGDALPLGPVLQSFSRVAVLGPPGAGKSTLLKRIALAHSGRGGLAVDDGYEADTRLVVVYMKCRLLEAPSMGVIEMILDAMDPEGVSNRDAMLQLLANALTGDGVLLLVDGLDEIADERHRAAFAASLQSFLLGHPKVRCVVTSREAGFRLVAGPITTVCEPFSLRPLSDRAITDLVERWFHLTIGESEESKALSRRVNEEIRLSLPVRRLATNPLLLTALLLVRRWAGSLPPQRTVLYDRAIDVLVNTWNVEGHTPMRSDETIPQLAFVAYRMLESGQQGVSLPTLQDHVTSVRKALPELLGFVGTSPAEFVERVEERSSLLSLTGHTTSEGRVVPVYEFKHLTFQEYLAAVAIAFDYGVVPDGLDITGEVRRNLDDDRWTETLSLLAVLSGRRASQVVDVMCDGLRKSTTRLDEHDPAKHAASARLTGMLLRAFEDG
ncbi:MAG TPA: NACHT domain-containing protein, partial [Iamia sp.]